MKKRVLSMLLAFILCFSTLPMTAFAQEAVQEADVVTEQAGPAAEQEEQQAAAAPGAETPADKNTTAATPGMEDSTAGEAPDTVKPTGESVSDSDAGTQDTAENGEKAAEVQAVQKLIDALPETVTEDNAESVSAQLEAIAEAMESLTEEQMAELDMEHLYAISEAMNAPMTVAAQHTHYLCGKETCNNVGGHTEESMTTFTHKLWMNGDTLMIDDNELSTTNGTSGYTGTCYVLPSGDYYLGSDITLSHPLYIGQDSSAKTVNLCLNGKSITEYGDVDAIILYRGYGSEVVFSLTDCGDTGKITHAAEKKGCGVYVYSNSRVTFNMYGGSVVGNTGSVTNSTSTSTINGGGVYMDNDYNYSTYGGIFNMYGGTIKNNSATNGGGVYMCNNVGNCFYMYGGSITDNTATDKGGGVYSAGGTITMTGGSIENNHALQGGGMYESGGSSVYFTMSGGSITGNTATDNGGGVYVSTGGSFGMSGSVQITGNTKDGAANNVELAAGKTITIQSDLTEDASIGVTTAKTPENGDFAKVAVGGEDHTLTDADGTHFFSDVDASKYTIECVGNKLILTNTGDSTLHHHPICGENCTHKNADGTAQHEEVYWEAASTLSNNMPAGYYYLTQDVTLNWTWQPADGMVLDLNGHDIIMNANCNVIAKYDSGTFTLTDCMGENNKYGKITHGENYTGGGIIIDSTYTNSFVMYGGSITGNTGSYPGVYLGYYSSSTKKSFTMYGGEITNNSNKSTTYAGGGVCIESTNVFTMIGGTISGNTAATNGGGVYAKAGSTFIMQGGSITDNTAANGGGVYVHKYYNTKDNFIVSGDVRITGNRKTDGTTDNVYLHTDDNEGKQSCIKVNGALSNAASIGVNAGTIDAGSYKIVAQGSEYQLTNDDLNHFKSDVADYTPKLVDNSIAFTNGTLHEHKICGKTDCNDGHSNALWIPLTYDDTAKTLKYGATIASSKKATNSTEHYVYTLPAGNYYLAQDITLEGSICISGNVNICLNGYEISTNQYNRIFEITNYKLAVCDCSTNHSGKIRGNQQSHVVHLQSSASFDLYGGTICGGKYGVYEGYASSGVTLFGGSITGNTNGASGSYTSPITIGGDAKVINNTTKNLFLRSNQVISIDDSLTQDAQIGISTVTNPSANNNIQIAISATNTKLDYSKIFTSDATDQNYVVTKDAKGRLYLGIHQHNWQATAEGAQITFKCNATGCNLGSDFATTYTVTAPTDLTYSGSEKVATVTTDDKYSDGLGLPAIPAITYQKYNGTAYISIEGVPKDVGTYQASITIDNVTASVTYDIVSKKVPNPTITVAGTYTYDGTKKEPSVVVKDGETEIPDSEYSVSYVDNINAGNATVTITDVDGGNYNVSGSKKFPIDKAIITVTPNTDQKKIYGDEDPTLKYNYAGAVAGETPAFAGRLSRVEGKNAGEYDIQSGTLALADNGSFKVANYELKLADTPVQFTIVPKTLSAEDLEFTPNTPITKKYDGTTTCTTAKVQIKDSAKADPNDEVPTVTGTYAYNSPNVKDACKVTFTSKETKTSNYILPEGLIVEQHNASITKANQDPITITSTSATYGTDLTLTVDGGSGNGALTYTVENGTGAATIIDGILHPDKVGEVTVQATKSGDDNYYDVQSARTTITIAKGTYPGTVSKTVNLIKGRSDAQTGTLTAADFFPEGAPEGAVISVLSESENMTMLDGGLKLDSTNQLTYTSGTYIVNADDQKCTVTISSDNYHDITATLIFHLTDKETVTISGLTYTGKTYDGKAMKPVGTLQVSGDKVPVSELEVTYTGIGDTTYNGTDVPTDAGTYQVTYKVREDNDNYIGEKTYTFTISPKAVTADMIGAMADETYTGSPITPQPVVMDGNTILTSGADFDFSYNENINAGKDTATLTITGKGNYTGTASRTFTISPKDIKGAVITLQADSLGYTGLMQEVQITSVTLNQVPLTANDYYIVNNSNEQISADASITLTIAGKGNYTGTAYTIWKITKASPVLGDFDVSPNLSTPLTYDGKPKEVTAKTKNGVIDMGDVTVCYEGISGTTYTRRETAPTNAGSYKVILSVAEGKNYTEAEIEAGTLTIEKANLTVEDVTEFFEYTKTGAQTISLAELVPGATNYAPGTYTDVNGILTGDLTIDATGLMKFALSALTKDNIDKKVTVPVIITSENYKDVTVKVTIYISPEYRIIDGANSSWTQNTDGTVVIRGNGEFSRFHAVKVDGKVIDPANYEAKEGSTIITLKAEYLKTLATGSHTFAIVWDNGIAGTNFTVAANTSGNNSGNNSNNNDSNHGSNNSGNTAGTAANTAAASAQELDKVPATGDPLGIWLMLFAISLTGLVGMLARRKKN